MAGPLGQSGQSARSPAGQELSRGVDHVMQPATPALDLLSRPASAASANATAEFARMEDGVCGRHGRPAQ